MRPGLNDCDVNNTLGFFNMVAMNEHKRKMAFSRDFLALIVVSEQNFNKSLRQ